MAPHRNQVRIHEDQIRVLQDGFKGQVVRPEDPDYDKVRAIWNGMIDRYPALIARCADTADVVAAVNFGRGQGLRTAVRGGGHNVAGLAIWDDSLVIDLSHMRAVQVDPQARTARAEGGATIGDLDRVTQGHGLAVPMGVVTETGIAGLTLGGGYGWLRNKYGLSCDSLIEAEVVTAGGEVVTTNESENFDLLWGLRGGGGNFGVVTSFVFRLYQVGPEVAFTFIFHNGEGDRMKKAIQFYRDYSSSAPDEISTLMATGMIPPDEHFPAEIHRKPFVLYGAMYAGDPQVGRRLMEPLVEFGEPLLDFSGIMPYLEAQQVFDEDYPNGMRYYWKSLNLSRLDDEVIDRIVQHARLQPSVLSTVDLWYIGGAVSRMDPEKSAFYGRGAAFLLSPEANWEDPADDEINITWLRSLIDDMQEFSDGSRYLNFAGFFEEGDDLVRSAFAHQHERLVALKRKYDPDNFFNLNQNIKPV